MGKRRTAIALTLAGVIIGFGGYFIVSRLPLLAWIGAISALGLVVAFVVEPDRGFYEADDLKRADKPEEHRMSEGPAPPFQS
jgi:hypothetical protein